MFNCSRAGATTQSSTRLTRRSHEDSKPIFFYLMCHYGKQTGPASREHPGQQADSHGRDIRSRRFTERRPFRRPTYATCFSIVTLFSPDPRHQHVHKHTEASEDTENEQHDHNAEAPTVQIRCSEHGSTSFRR